jgi:hypothetical protein
MKTLLVLIITWATATLLLLWLGDYNMYVDFPDGRVYVKQHARFQERAFESILFAGLYSGLNTGLLWSLHKFNERRRRKAQQ